MLPVLKESKRGYLSLIQWTDNVDTSSYQNLAVILISRGDDYKGMKFVERDKMPRYIPNADKLHAWMDSVAQKLRAIEIPELQLFSRMFQSSVNITAPARCNVPNGDWERCLEILWLLFAA